MKDLDRSGLEARIARAVPDAGHAEKLVDAYAAARKEDPASAEDAKRIYTAIQTDRIFRVPAIRLAEAHATHQPATWMYLFSWPSPARRGELGACHAVEIPFVFGTLDAPGMARFSGSGPDAERLAGKTMDAWIEFARTGEPGHPDLPDWPAYETGQRATMQLDAESRVVHAPMEEERAVWDVIAG
jgi:para-nitrobenzyl esterase